MMKTTTISRLKGGLLVVVFTLLTVSQVWSQQTFADIPASAWSFKCLLYIKCGQNGHVHGAIPDGTELMNNFSDQYGFTVDFSDDNNDFTKENLGQYDVILLNNTTKPQESLNASQKEALIWYVEEFTGTGNGGRDRGGVFGWHGATDMAMGESGSWPWYHDWLGGTYNGATGGNADVIQAEESPEDFPAFIEMPASFNISEEWYKWETPPQSKEGVVPVMWIEGSGERRLITWITTQERALSIFSGIGHVNALFDDERVQNHFLGSVLYASGYGQEVVGCMEADATNFEPLATSPCDNCCEYEACCGTEGFEEYVAGCKNPQENVCITVGISPVDIQKAVTVTPKLVSIATNGKHTVEVINVNGETVFAENSTGSREYSLSGLQSGIYFVKVNAADQHLDRKVFVE